MLQQPIDSIIVVTTPSVYYVYSLCLWVNKCNSYSYIAIFLTFTVNVEMFMRYIFSRNFVCRA